MIRLVAGPGRRLLVTLARLPARLLRTLVAAYQRLLSPLLPGACRFHPTCSVYAAEALRLHGALRGSWLAALRLLRCQPWAAGGIDFVPLPEKPRPAGGSPPSHSQRRA